MALMDEVLGSTLQQAGGYFGIQTLFPAIQEFAELNTNIKMVNAQLGETYKISSPLNKSIAGLARSTGLSTTKLLGAASAASKYNKTLGKDLMQSTVMFADATGMSSESVGDFIGKMLSIGAVSENSYKNMLEGILQVRDTYGLTSEAMDDLLRVTTKYALITGETDGKIESASAKMAEFTTRLKAAGVETSTITELIDRMIDPNKMEDNLMLLSKMGMSIHDLTVGDPLKDLESMAPRLKSIAQEVIAQPNRMIANEMAKMYGYTLEEMREFSKIDTSKRAIEERKTLEKYREEIMTATTSLKDLGSNIFGTVAEFLNSTIMPIFDNLGPKTSGILAAGISIAITKLIRGIANIGRRTEESGRKAGGIIRYSLTSGAEEASEILRVGISRSFSDINNTTKNKAGFDAKELETPTTKNKRVAKSPLSRTDRMVKEYNDSVYDALVESEIRLKEHSRKIEEFKSTPGKIRDYYKQNIDIIREMNKEDLNWFEKKSLQQRERKFDKPIKFKKPRRGGSLEEQYNLVKERTAEMYEQYLERDTNVQKIKLNIKNLEDLKKEGGISDYQQKELNRMNALAKSLEGQNINFFEKIKGTTSGKDLLSTLYKSDVNDLETYKSQRANLEKELREASAELEKIGKNKNTEQVNKLKATIKNLEDGIKQVDTLHDSVEARVLETEKIKDITNRKIDIDTSRQASIYDTKALIEAEKIMNRMEKKQNRRTALGLDPNANIGRVGLAYAGTVARDGVGKAGTAVKGMAKGMLGGITSMLNPASLAMMGGTMLVGTLMKNEEFQKTITGLVGNISKVISPIIDWLAKAIGIPLKWINRGLEKLLALPIFKQEDKVTEDKQNIVSDMSKYNEAEKDAKITIKTVESKLGIIAECLIENNEHAKSTKESNEAMAYQAMNSK